MSGQTDTWANQQQSSHFECHNQKRLSNCGRLWSCGRHRQQRWCGPRRTSPSPDQQTRPNHYGDLQLYQSRDDNWSKCLSGNRWKTEWRPLTAVKLQYILEHATLNVPEEFKQKYLDLLLKHHEVISDNKYNLGKCSTAMHDIELKSETPIYVKQIKIQKDQQAASSDMWKSCWSSEWSGPPTASSTVQCSSWLRRTEASELFKTSGQSTNKLWWTSTPWGMCKSVSTKLEEQAPPFSHWST